MDDDPLVTTSVPGTADMFDVVVFNGGANHAAVRSLFVEISQLPLSATVDLLAALPATVVSGVPMSLASEVRRRLHELGADSLVIRSRSMTGELDEGNSVIRHKHEWAQLMATVPAAERVHALETPVPTHGRRVSNVGLLVLVMLFGACLWVVQRESISSWLRLAGGFGALMAVGGVAGVLGPRVGEPAARKVGGFFGIVLLTTSICSAQGFWANVPTSGHAHQTASPGEGGVSGYTRPATSVGGNPGGTNDSTIKNPYWSSCKSQLGYGSVFDSDLTDQQYVTVMACAVNDGITNAENPGG